MNLILLTPEEAEGKFLPWSDPRAIHIKSILRLAEGETFEAGMIEGPRGTATVVRRDESGIYFDPVWGEEDPPLYPLTLLVGLVRPPTARRLLKDMTTFGVDRILFTATDLGEKSYRQSKLWKTDQWKNAILDGAQQAVSCRIPSVELCWSLADALKKRGDSGPLIVLDNGSDCPPIHRVDLSGGRITAAIGSERGWSDRERQMLADNGGRFCRMGDRVLRTETACPTALGILFSRLGYYGN